MEDRIDNTFTSGTGILRIEDKITVPTGIEVKREYDLSQYYLKDLDFQSVRGRIINATLYIEEKIDKILAKILVGQERSKLDIFNTVVLKREFFNLMSKWKILRDLLKNVDPYKQSDHSNLIKEIKNIIDTRDMFAHGRNTHKGDIIVIDYFSGEPKRQEITGQYLSDLDKIIKSLYQQLDELMNV